MARQAALQTADPGLEKLMQVTSAKGWLAVGIIGVVLAGVIVWSLVGSIPERIEGQGLLTQGGGLRQLRASGSGTLTKLALKINDTVAEGEIVGEISQVGTSEEIKTAREQFDQAQREYEVSKAEDEATIAGIRSTIAGLEAEKRSTQLLLQKANEDVVRKSEALKSGLVTARSVEQAERDRASLESQLTGKDAQIQSQNAQIRSLLQRIRAKEDAVAKARREFERVGAVTTSLAQIQSTVAGRVVELKKRVGDLVQNGDIVATVEPPSSGVEPVVYISSANGKRIKPGMEAQLVPLTVRREEFGYMKGRVQNVGEFPVTPEAVNAVTANEQLTRELLASGTKIEVHIAPERSASTPSGYEWSSSRGPDRDKVTGGTRISVAVIVARKPPISYVLPIFKSTLGG